MSAASLSLAVMRAEKMVEYTTPTNIEDTNPVDASERISSAIADLLALAEKLNLDKDDLIRFGRQLHTGDLVIGS